MSAAYHKEIADRVVAALAQPGRGLEQRPGGGLRVARHSSKGWGGLIVRSLVKRNKALCDLGKNIPNRVTIS